MAASIGTSSSSSENDENSEKLDPLSPCFDPRRALYAKSLKVPIPDAKLFNNLAEFENYLKGTDSDSQKKMQKEKVKLPGIVAEKAAAQAREAVRKAAITAKSGGAHEKSQTQMRKLRATNVFTRIEGYKGPLSVLSKCVQEKLKVVVVVRAAVSVRSRCKGYVIAFDKHFNMALMDVDETYIRMCKENKDTNTQEQSDVTSSKSASDAKKLIRPQDLRPESSAKTTASIVQEKLSKIFHGASPNRSSLSQSYTEKCNISRPAYRKIDSPGASKKSSLESDSSRTKVKDEREIESELQRAGDHSSILSKTSYSENSRRKDRQTERQSGKQKIEEKPSTSAGQTDMNTNSQSGSKEKGRQSREEADFWEVYRVWAEKRCLSKFELLERHVNQLFIRGDNVVSVSIAQ